MSNFTNIQSPPTHDNEIGGTLTIADTLPIYDDSTYTPKSMIHQATTHEDFGNSRFQNPLQSLGSKNKVTPNGFIRPDMSFTSNYGSSVYEKDVSSSMQTLVGVHDKKDSKSSEILNDDLDERRYEHNGLPTIESVRTSIDMSYYEERPSGRLSSYIASSTNSNSNRSSKRPYSLVPYGADYSDSEIYVTASRADSQASINTIDYDNNPDLVTLSRNNNSANQDLGHLQLDTFVGDDIVKLSQDELNALLNQNIDQNKLFSYLAAEHYIQSNGIDFTPNRNLSNDLESYKNVYIEGTKYPNLEGKVHVFVHDENEKCTILTVPPNTTVNEVRLMWLKNNDISEETESFKVYIINSTPGVFRDLQADPNSPVDFLKNDADSTLKLKVRHTNPPRWNVNIFVSGKGIRSIMVSSDTTVSYVTSILMCIESIPKDEEGKWVLCISRDDGTSLPLYSTLKVFKLGDTVTKFAFSKVQKRNAKLAGILGLPSTVVEELANKESTTAEDELRRRAALSKSSKATSLLGLNDNDLPSPGGSIRKKNAKSVYRADEIFELGDDKLNTFNFKSKSKKDNLVVNVAKKNLINKIRTASYDSLSTSTGNLESANEIKEEQPTRRTDKLADFFGVKKPKEVDQMKTALSTQTPLEATSSLISFAPGSTTDLDTSKFNAKIHFANMTYLIAKLSINSVALMAKAYVLKELNVSESSEQYGLYVYSPDTFGERHLEDDEKLYDTMISWDHNEIFLFKRKNISHLRSSRRSSLVSTSQRSLNTPIYGISGGMRPSRTISSLKTWMENEKSIVPEKRVAKLAGFFGIQMNAQDKDGSSEISELYKVMNALVTKDGTDGLNTKVIEKNKSINIASIRREGWLQHYNNSKKTWESCWAAVEKDILKLTPSNRNAFIQQSGVIIYISLESCTVQGGKSVGGKKSAFVIMDRRNNRHILSAASFAEEEDWIHSIRQTALSSQDTKRYGSKPVKDKSSFTKDVDNVVEKVYQHSFGNKASLVPQKISMEDFEIHRVIGRGKYAKVLLCCRKSTGKVYAIKVIYKSNDMGESYESQILRSIQHPFIVSLYYAFQTSDRLYLVMEYVNGGELYFHVSNFGRFAENRVKFYAAEILSALECLHDKGIIYRDLKLENILLHKDGHIKIADFGLSIEADQLSKENSNSIIGTLEYLAPEILQGSGHTKSSDYWAFGVVIYEMLCGSHPFYSDDRDEIEYNILNSEITYAKWVTAPAENLISGLFDRNPNTRLGSGENGIQVIKNHPFFYGIDWDKLINKEIEVPFKPELTDDFDVSFFDEQFTGEYAGLTPIGSEEDMTDAQNVDIEGFSFIGDRE